MRSLFLVALAGWAQTTVGPTDVAGALAPAFAGPCRMAGSGEGTRFQCGSRAGGLVVTISPTRASELIIVRGKIATELAAMAEREKTENPRLGAPAYAALARLGRQEQTPAGRPVYYTLMPTGNGGGEQAVLVVDRASNSVLTLTQPIGAGAGDVVDDALYRRLKAAALRLERVVWREAK